MKHIKSFLSVLLSLTIVFSVAAVSISSASATTIFTVNDVQYSIVSNYEAHVYKYEGTEPVIEIPEKIGARVITAVDSSAFYENESIEQVILPDSVLSIGDMAFMYCTNLKDVDISVNLNSIGDYAFGGCTALSEIDLNSNISSLSVGMFDASGITNVKIPYNVTEIKKNAFRNCNSLTSIRIPDYVTKIYDNAFRNCKNLESVEIGSGITTIPATVFMNCEKLSAVLIPESVTSIDVTAFTNCPNISIYGYKDSYAQQFAEENSINFVLIPEYEIGDVDMSGIVDIRDATLIQSYAASIKSLSDYQLSIADVNGDGTVNVSDATQIQRILAEIV